MTAALEQEAEASQFLSFFLDDESFAIEVSKVREVVDCSAGLTRVPRMPAFMRGVLNLRGSVLPVVDMGVRFGMGDIVETVETCIIVVEVDVDGEPTMLGAMVDRVDEVFELSPDSLESPPKMGAKLPTEYIKSMAPRDGEFCIVLDVDRVLSTDEIIAVRKAGKPAEQSKRKVK